METSEREGQDQNADSRQNSRPADQSETGHDDLGSRSQVVGTYDSPVRSGPGPRVNLEAHPDRVMVIETNRIREPDEGYLSNLVVVPVEIRDPAREQRSGAKSQEDDGEAGGDQKREQSGQGEPNSKGSNQAKDEKPSDKKKAAGDKDEEDQSNPGDHGSNGSKPSRSVDKASGEQNAKDDKNQKGSVRSAMTSSPARNLLLSGLVALVCGVAGAWAYSYFFGSDKAKDQNSSEKGSDSKKDSKSDKSSGSSQDSGSSKGSKSGKSSKPGEGPGSGKDSDQSQNDPNQGEWLQSQQAWLLAMKELQEAKDNEKAARHAEDEKKAVLEFLKMTLLSAGRPGDTSLTEAFWSGGKGKDVTLRKAVDLAESKVTPSFSNRPVAEATVREMLGAAYLNLGDPAASVNQYERALALRQAMQGFDAPETAVCRNQMAVAYRLAGRAGEGSHLFDRNPESTTQAAALATHGMTLLLQGKPAEAELKLRESLTIQQKAQPDDWSTFVTRSALGEALLDQGKFADAEPPLLSGYEGLKQREAVIPTEERPRVAKALERLVRLYDTWGKDEVARKWRKKMEEGVVIH